MRLELCPAASCHQLSFFQELQAERTYGDEFSLKLALGLVARQDVEQVRQLHPVAHDPVGQLVPKLPAYIQAIVGIKKDAHGVRHAHQTVCERFEQAEAEQGK